MEMFDSDIFCKRANDLFDGMGQMELSQKMGLSQGVISAIKNGKSKTPAADTIFKISKFFDVSSDWLLGLSDVQSTNPATKELCQTLGLSENAVETIINCHQEEKANDLPDSSEMVSHIIENENFWRIVFEFVNAKHFKPFLEKNPEIIRQIVLDRSPKKMTVSDINREMFSLVAFRGIDSIFKQSIAEDVWKLFDEVVKEDHDEKS